MEVDPTTPRVTMVPIQLPTCVNVDLDIHFELLPNYYDDCRNINHRIGTCHAITNGEENGIEQR